MKSAMDLHWMRFGFHFLKLLFIYCLLGDIFIATSHLEMGKNPSVSQSVAKNDFAKEHLSSFYNIQSI